METELRDLDLIVTVTHVATVESDACDLLIFISLGTLLSADWM